jgi:hypothetical protein
MSTHSQLMTSRRTSMPRDPIGENQHEHQITVLSAALLRSVINTCGQDLVSFAESAGLAAEVMAGVLSGLEPAWALPYDHFTALADAVAAVWPCEAFETATACDLLLSCVLDGEQHMATDVLTEPSSQGLARALIRLVASSAADDGESTAKRALLPEGLLAPLTDQATALAGSRSPDAWVGLEILAALPGRHS